MRWHDVGMQIVKRLLVAYAVILIVLAMFVVAFGQMIGPIELLMALVLTLAAAVYNTRKIVRHASRRRLVTGPESGVVRRRS